MSSAQFPRGDEESDEEEFNEDDGTWLSLVELAEPFLEPSVLFFFSFLFSSLQSLCTSVYSPLERSRSFETGFASDRDRRV